MSNSPSAETSLAAAATGQADRLESDNTRQKSPKISMPVCVLAIVSIAGVFAAAYFAGQANALREANAQTLPSSLDDKLVGQMGSEDLARLAAQLPTLDATAAVSSEKFSMATGLVSNRAEGLFVLDHNSGLLQCSVMYPQVGKFLGLFTVNVHDALGTGKGAQYMMATGLVDMQSSSNNPIASSVVYVLNNTNGAYACYYIPFNEALMNRRQPQSQNMRLLGVGSADPVVDRDSLR